MTKCNATLVTATVEPCQSEPCSCGRHCSNPFCIGNEVVTLHTLTCHPHAHSGGGRSHTNGQVSWFDDTPGAKPHVEPEVLVTDEEVAEATRVFALSSGLTGDERIRHTLRAAARVRKQQEVDRD